MKDEKMVIYTARKIQEMKDELNDLINVKRPENLEALNLARSQGDLSENADYDAAKKTQAEIEGRIYELTNKLEHAQVASSSSAKFIGITDVVTFKNIEKNEEITVQVVSSDESDVLAQPVKISATSPLGQVLLGKGVGGDTLTVEAKHPYNIEIISFHHAE